jgi:hypothetical protein
MALPRDVLRLPTQETVNGTVNSFSVPNVPQRGRYPVRKDLASGISSVVPFVR